MVRETSGLLRPYGSRSSRASVGGSVARASEAKTFLPHITAFTMLLKLSSVRMMSDASFATEADVRFLEGGAVICSVSSYSDNLTLLQHVWLLTFDQSVFVCRRRSGEDSQLWPNLVDTLLLNLKSSPGWMMPHLVAMARAVSMVFDADHAEAGESGEDVRLVFPVGLSLSGGEVSVGEADGPEALRRHRLDHLLHQVFSHGAHGLPHRVEGVDLEQFLFWDFVADGLVVSVQVEGESHNRVRSTCCCSEGRTLHHVGEPGRPDRDLEPGVCLRSDIHSVIYHTLPHRTKAAFLLVHITVFTSAEQREDDPSLRVFPHSRDQHLTRALHHMGTWERD
ncbi:hypothetical protein F7725_015941 [Dissostichus mawsoni]|uniref:Uncharacterized protein n=1 Tax=Dissostichus mawsoni TaxID=36200 RepID=A0A7J5Y451_DISMA|nr:hypothetical protein F7725_015941 [Dissostichus mawsoni]